MLANKKINNVYICLIGYTLIYVLYYCVLTVVLYSYGVSVAVTTAMALALAINTIRKKEKKRGIEWKTALGLKKVRLDKKNLITLIMLGVGLNFVISGVLNILPSSVSSGYRGTSGVILGGNLYATVIVIAIVTPLLEEIFFRGIFQRRLSESFGQINGLIIGTCIFGFMHFNIVWSIYAAIIGFFLGCLYLYYDSVFPGAIVHCLFNLISCIPLAISKYERLYKDTFGNKIYVIVTLLIGIVLLYYVVDKTWIKMFFDRSFYNNKLIDEVVSDENV